jgi:hypothetical protein
VFLLTKLTSNADYASLKSFDTRDSSSPKTQETKLNTGKLGQKLKNGATKTASAVTNAFTGATLSPSTTGPAHATSLGL